MTARILSVEYPPVAALPVETLEETAQLIFLLKRAARSRRSARPRAPGCAARGCSSTCCSTARCPRTVLFCLEGCRRSLERDRRAASGPERAIGRLTSELVVPRVHRARAESGSNHLLERVLQGIASAGEEIAAAYFTTPRFVPGAYAQAQQQQQ